MTDDLRSDAMNLIARIHALLNLDKSGALVPNGIGGFARDLLSSAASQLAQLHNLLGMLGDATAERDEARECVGRLYGIIRLLYMSAEIDQGQWDEALAATPSHLREPVANAERSGGQNGQ